MSGRGVEFFAQVPELAFCVVTEELATADDVSVVELEKLGPHTLEKLPR